MSDRRTGSKPKPDPPDNGGSGLRSATEKLPFVPGHELAREYEARLELKVQERTAELRQANAALAAEVKERQQAEEALQQSLEYQSTMNTLLGVAMTEAPLERLLHRALDKVLSLPAFGQDSAAAIFVREPPDSLRLLAERSMPAAVLEQCQQVATDECRCGQTARVGELLDFTRLDLDDSSPCRTDGHRGHCCVPISARGEVLGVLSLLLPRDWGLTEWEVRVLGGVADVLASIIARKRIEAERAELQEQLSYSQKLEAVGRLAGGVAHDFNNLLTVIQGNVYLNLSDPELPEELRSDLEGIEDAARRASTLTRQLLAFGRNQVLRPQDVDVNTVVQELQKMLRRVIGEDVDLQVSLEHGLWRTEVDPGQLEQVILNLAVNARDAMPRGGVLTIETANVIVEPRKRRHRSGILPGSYVRLIVRDTGIGMDADVLEHLFEPFYTTKELGDGSGLGLATAYGIVRQSGGYIWADSQPGRGTALVIHLPRLEPSQAEAPVAPEAPSETCTILLVEDEPFVRRVARRVLAAEGHEVLEAEDVESALATVEAYGGDLHLLLTDVVMPGQSGGELADQLRALRPGLKVLFMSGYNDDLLRERGVSAEHLIRKPFTPAELSGAVSQLIRGGE